MSYLHSSLLLTVTMLLGVGCCGVPLVDCIRPWEFVGLHDQREEQPLVRTDSVLITVRASVVEMGGGASLEEALAKQVGNDLNVALRFSVYNLSDDTLSLYLDGLRANFSIGREEVEGETESAISPIVVGPQVGANDRLVFLSFPIPEGAHSDPDSLGQDFLLTVELNRVEIIGQPIPASPVRFVLVDPD